MTADLGAPETKADYVYRTLREDIVSGRVGSGERLRLAALAGRLHTSEMPVREALRMLQRDGLVEMENHRGATVATVDWDRVIETVAVRMHLEVLALRESVDHHSDETLGHVAGMIDEMDEALRADELDAFSDANRRFHRALYAPGPNRVLKEQIEALWDLVWRERSRSLFRLDPQRARGAQSEHRAMLEAMCRRDAGASGEVAESHRRHTLEAWRAAVARPRPRAT